MLNKTAIPFESLSRNTVGTAIWRGWVQKLGILGSTSVTGNRMSNSNSFWLINNAPQERIFCLITEVAQAQILSII